jgi:hypothetical protein
MQRIIILIGFLLLTRVGSIAQLQKINIQIIDSITKSPLSYSAIINKSNKDYIDCDENGMGSMNVKLNDTLVISRIGYIDKLVKLTQIQNEIVISLIQTIDTLDNIEIKPFNEKWSTGTFASKTDRSINNGSESFPNQIVSQVTLPSGTKIFELTHFQIKQKRFIPDYIKINVYEILPNGLPGRQLLNQPIIVGENCFSNGLITVDLKEKLPYILDSSFFVGIQWLTYKNGLCKNCPDIGIQETKRFAKPITYYSSKSYNGAWVQEFTNGIRIFDLQNSESFRQILYDPKKQIGMPLNLVFEVEGKILR